MDSYRGVFEAYTVCACGRKEALRSWENITKTQEINTTAIYPPLRVKD